MTILMKLFEKIACLNFCQLILSFTAVLKCEESKPTSPPPSKLSPGGAVDFPIHHLWSG